MKLLHRICNENVPLQRSVHQDVCNVHAVCSVDIYVRCFSDNLAFKKRSTWSQACALPSPSQSSCLKYVRTPREQAISSRQAAQRSNCGLFWPGDHRIWSTHKTCSGTLCLDLLEVCIQLWCRSEQLTAGGKTVSTSMFGREDMFTQRCNFQYWSYVEQSFSQATLTNNFYTRRNNLYHHGEKVIALDI